MPFLCPACEAHKALRITASLELPPDSRSDEITLQIVECARCDFAGVAVYQESRRGALDSESVDHAGVRVGKEDLKALRKAIRQCPEPRNPRCTCETHRTLGHKNEYGRWDALDDIPYEGVFPIRL